MQTTLSRLSQYRLRRAMACLDNITEDIAALRGLLGTSETLRRSMRSAFTAKSLVDQVLKVGGTVDFSTGAGNPKSCAATEVSNETLGG